MLNILKDLLVCIVGLFMLSCMVLGTAMIAYAWYKTTFVRLTKMFERRP